VPALVGATCVGADGGGGQSVWVTGPEGRVTPGSVVTWRLSGIARGLGPSRIDGMVAPAAAVGEPSAGSRRRRGGCGDFRHATSGSASTTGYLPLCAFEPRASGDNIASP
jgi:hypothetical protein